MEKSFVSILLLSAALFTLVPQKTLASETVSNQKNILVTQDAAIQQMKVYLEEEYDLSVMSVNVDLNLGFPLIAFNTSNGVLYYSSDLKKAITGDIYDIENNWLNLSKLAPSEFKLDEIYNIADTALIYKAPEEKHKLYVFTDADCGYCVTMHEEITQYLNAGISIYYFALPLEGEDSDSAIQLAHAWCANNKVREFNKVMSGNLQEERTTAQCRKIIKSHINVAEAIGIDGTPALVFENGALQMGYYDVEEVLTRINVISQ